MADTPIHTRWWGMIQRCNQPSNTSYKNYGAKGIKVCDRWLTFENFYADMGDPPFPKAQIDRIDPDGDYCPENCRWLSAFENNSRAHAGKKYRTRKAVPPCQGDTTLP